MEVIYLKIVLFIIAFNTFAWYWFKRKGYTFDSLGCGITAFCGNKPADPNLIKMIMMFNMERGEDGTGWAVNNIVEKDTEKVTKFLQAHSLDITPEDENFTIIAHARKSSSGTKHNKELVHPFSIYKNGVEKEKHDLILAMNGTLFNTALMASTFDIEYKEYTNSDTQVMAKAMANLGEKEYIKVIEGYDGTATLVFFTPKHPNTLMVYKDPQKTLFYWQKGVNEMYISSIEEPLLAIGASKLDVFKFEDEFLYRISKGKITKKDKIERNPLKPRAIHKSNGAGSFYRERDALYEGETVCNFSNVMSPLGGNRKFKPLSITAPKNAHAGKGNLVYCIEDKYYRNGHPCDTVIYMNDNGEVNKVSKEEDNYKKYFFVVGYMCKDENSYDELNKLCSDNKGLFDKKKFKSMLLSSLVDFFKYPILTSVEGKVKWILNKEYSSKLEQSNEIHLDFMLSSYIIKIKDSMEFTATTLKDVCHAVEYIEKKNNPKPNDINTTDLDKINTKTCLTDQHLELIKLIKNDNRKAYRPSYFFSLMRLNIYQCNAFPALYIQFYNILLSELKNFTIITTEVFNRLKSELNDNGYEKHIFTDEITSYIKQLHDRLNNVKTKIDDQLSTKDKLLLVENDTFTPEDVIESIEKNNSFFLNDSFNNDLIDYKKGTFDEFLVEWVSTDSNGDVNPFLEGILLCFRKVGHITSAELLDILDNGYIDLKNKTERVWKDWIDTYNAASDFAVSEVNGIIDEAIVIESETPESIEKECRMNIENIVDSIKDYIKEVEFIEVDDRTEYVEKSLNHMNSILLYIGRYLIKSEKASKNENQQ